jgi:hypothetical protein
MLCTFTSALPAVCVQCQIWLFSYSPLISCFHGMLLRYSLNYFETVPVAPIITGITISPYHNITVSPYHRITTSPYHHITISPYHHIAVSPYHRITISPYRRITISPYHHITISPNHHITVSPYHRITVLLLLSHSTCAEFLL